MIRVPCFIAVLLFCLSVSAQTKVYLIPTLHSLHRTNERYTYDTLRAVVERLRPDVIVAEIRAEDMGRDTAYLKKNYPYEMWMMPAWFPGATHEGFDWLGEGLAGRPVPDRYWKDSSRIKALERLSDIDTVHAARKKACALYADERLRLLQSGSLKDILQGSDAILIREYYGCLQGLYRGTRYGELTQFYEERNRRMGENLSRLLQKQSGKTVVILTGDDHRPYLADYLRRQGYCLVQP